MLAGDVTSFDRTSLRAALIARFPHAEDISIGVSPASIKLEITFIMADVSAANSVASTFANTTVAEMEADWFGTLNGGNGIQIESRGNAVVIPQGIVTAPVPPPPSPPPPSPPPLLPPPSPPPSPISPPTLTVDMLVTVGVTGGAIGGGAVFCSVLMVVGWSWYRARRRREKESRERAEQAALEAMERAEAAEEERKAAERAVAAKAAAARLEMERRAKALPPPHWSELEPTEPLPTNVVAEAKQMLETLLAAGGESYHASPERSGGTMARSPSYSAPARTTQGTMQLPYPAPLPPFTPVGLLRREVTTTTTTSRSEYVVPSASYGYDTPYRPYSRSDYTA